ncbi:MAG: hypothetical protein ACT4NY_22330 [Pseudonocardiales bacterium]
MPEQSLRDADWPVDGLVVWVHPIGAADVADVLGNERILQLREMPELSRYYGRDDEPVT